MNFFDRMIERFEVVGRARTLSVLRQQSDRTLIDLGFSPEMIRLGIKAWPWRAEDENDAVLDVNPVATIAGAPLANVGRVGVVETGKAANGSLETAA